MLNSIPWLYQLSFSFLDTFNMAWTEVGILLSLFCSFQTTAFSFLCKISLLYWGSYLLALVTPFILIIILQPLRLSLQFTECCYGPSSQTSILCQLWNSFWGKSYKILDLPCSNEIQFTLNLLKSFIWIIL